MLVYYYHSDLPQINQLKVLHILLSNDPSEPGSTVKQEQEDISLKLLGDICGFKIISGKNVQCEPGGLLFARRCCMSDCNLLSADEGRRTGDGRGAARIFNGISINY